MTRPKLVIISTTMLARNCKGLFEMLIMVSMMLPGVINGWSRTNPPIADATA